MGMSNRTEWIHCPVCGNKTRLQIRENTKLKDFPFYCPKCKQECLIEAKDLHITVIKEPDAQTQSRQGYKKSGFYGAKQYGNQACFIFS